MRQTIQVLLAALTVAVQVTGADDFYLRHGDRVVFYGDSITDQRLYTVIAETYVVTRYPGAGCRLYPLRLGRRPRHRRRRRAHRYSPPARRDRIQADGDDHHAGHERRGVRR